MRPNANNLMVTLLEKNIIWVGLFSFMFTINVQAQSINLKKLSSNIGTQVEQQEEIQYDFLQGRHLVFGIDKCDEVLPLWGNCFGANPDTPYIIPAFPLAPSEYYDATYSHALDIVENDTVFRSATRMHPSEVRVMLIQLPSRGAYFGVQTYLFSRKGQATDDAFSSILPDTISPNPSRFSVFNSISNPINNVQIAEGLGKAEPWNEVIAVVVSHDANSVEAVKPFLLANGISEKAIFVEQLGDINQFGLDEGADDFLTLVRYTLPETDAGKTFYDNPSMMSFRFVPKGVTQPQGFANQVIETRSGNDESSLNAQLEEVTYRVANAVIGSGRTRLLTINPLNLGIDTYQCVLNSRNCLGDTRDTDTYLVSTATALNTNEVIVVGGINHNKLGNSTYFSILASDSEELRSAEIISDGNEVSYSLSQVGEAAGFSSANVKKVMDDSASDLVSALGVRLTANARRQLPKLWIKVFARSGNNKNICAKIPHCHVISDDPVLGVEKSRDLNIMRRVYMKPGTRRGPDQNKLLNPVLYKGTAK